MEQQWSDFSVMKKLLIFLAMLFPCVAIAQTYPSPTFNSVTLQNPLTGANGGTGINNGSNTLTLGANLTLSGSNPLVLTTTGSTSITLPTSGTLLTSSGAASTYAPIASPTFTGTVTIPGGASIAGYATSGVNSSITSITGLTTPLSQAQGGTGAASASAALTALGAAPLANPTFTGTVTIPGGASITGYATSGANTSLTSLANVSSIGGMPIYSVLQYGAVCNGSTNDAAAIQSAISAAQTAGGGVIVFPPGKTCDISSTLAVTASNVGFYCPSGGSVPFDINITLNPTNPNACTLEWTGSSGGTMMSFIAPTGSTSDLPLMGNSVNGMQFNANLGLAANGIVLETVDGGRFMNDTFYNFGSGNTIDVDVVHISSTNFNQNASADSQYDSFNGIFIQNFPTSGNGSNGIMLNSYSGGSAGNLNVNASFNTFENISISTGGTGEGIICNGCDTNFFKLLGIGVASSSIPAIDFTINTSGTNWLIGNNNIIDSLSTHGEILGRGQSSFPTCTSAFTTLTTTSCTFANVIHNMDVTNGTSTPAVEAGAQLMYRRVNGYSGTQSYGRSAFGDSSSAALQAAGAVGNETIRIENNNGNNLLLTDGTDSNEWSINIDGSENLRFDAPKGGSGFLSTPGIIATGSISAGGNDALLYGNSSGQSIPSGTATTVTGWTKVTDRLSASFNASTGIFTAPATGYYFISAALQYGTSVSTIGNQFAIEIIANSVGICSGIDFSQSATSDSHFVNASCMTSLSAGQTAFIQAFQNTGSSEAITTNPATNYITIYRVP